MKTRALSWIVFVSCLIAACSTPTSELPPLPVPQPKEDSARISLPLQGVQYIDTASSEVVWNGFEIGKAHSGKVSIKSGEVHVNTGMVTGGNLELDMNRITNTDIKDLDKSKKLVDHLKNEDFFDTKLFPTSSIQLEEVRKEKEGNKYLLLGKITLKGLTKPVTIPADIRYKEGQLWISGTFKLDRTQYGIKYSSKSFFKDLGDEFIYDEIELVFNLKTIKK